MKGESE